MRSGWLPRTRGDEQCSRASRVTGLSSSHASRATLAGGMVVQLESRLAQTGLTARLRAAVGLVVAKVDPDQIILFGSAARGEMTPSSDIDLLAIRPGNAGQPSQEHWKCGETGDRLDVVIMDRSTAERHRLSAYYVQALALEEGRTIYARPGARLLRTGPTYYWNGAAMVRTTKFEPDHAQTLLEKGERRWGQANEARHPADKCEFLQQAIEHALKALIVASGRRVDHTHDLNDLWDQAETGSEPIAASRDSAGLTKLSRYAGDWRYEVPADENPAGTWEQNRRTGDDVVSDARRRVPGLVEKTRSELQRASRAGKGGLEGPPLSAADPRVGEPPKRPQPASGTRQPTGRQRGSQR